MMIPLVDFVPSNYTYFLAAVAAYIVTEFLWYSNYLFGKKWHKLSKVKAKAMTYQVGLAWFVIGAVAVAVLMALIQHMGAASWQDSICIAVYGWLGFIVPTKACALIYTKKSYEQFAIEVFGALAAYAAAAYVISYCIFM